MSLLPRYFGPPCICNVWDPKNIEQNLHCVSAVLNYNPTMGTVWQGAVLPGHASILYNYIASLTNAIKTT